MKTDLYWIDGPWPGRLAIMPRPRGGEWLSDEVSSWRRDGVQVVVSLLTPEESEELELTREAEACAAQDVEFRICAVPDRGVPSSSNAILDLVRKLETDLTAGKDVAVHCRLGVGRSGMLAACLLAASGVAVDDAFKKIAAARGRPVPDTEQQQQWTVRFADGLLAAPSKN